MGPLRVHLEGTSEMKLRLLATISLLANIGLVLLVLRAGGGSASVSGHEEERTASRAALEASRLKTNLTRIEVTITNEASPFHWSDVASEDFKQYVAGLESIGCPPQTVRDIIKAELTTVFLARRRAIVEPLQRHWWVISAQGRELDDETQPYEDAIKELEGETLGKLDEYVGGDGKMTTRKDPRRQFDPETAFLPEEQRKALEQLHEQFNEEISKLRPANGAKDTSELRARREALDKKRWESVAKLLAPEENEEYQLRRSRHAHEAQASTGFEGTPEEARAIARIHQQYKDPPDNVSKKDPGYAAKKAAADEIRRQREEAMKTALGSERYAQFMQGFDGNFRDVFRITERYGLSREAAAEAAEVLRARNEALKNLTADKAIAAQERAQLELAAMQATRAALLQALGERALHTYERYHGSIVPGADSASARE